MEKKILLMLQDGGNKDGSKSIYKIIFIFDQTLINLFN